MSGGITVKEFKYIPGVNDAEYIKKLEELHEIDKRIISKAVAKIKMLSVQPEHEIGRWEPFDVPWYRCSECGAVRENITFMENFCPNCGADMRGDKHETD